MYGYGYDDYLAGLSQWLHYGVGALSALVCLGVIIRVLFVPVETRRGCTCGGCGHTIVAPLPERCPECGGLLTRVGLSTPVQAVRQRGSLAWALLAWTVFGGVGAEYAWNHIQKDAWQKYQQVYQQQQLPPSPPVPTTLEHSIARTFTPVGPAVSAPATEDTLHIDLDLSYIADAGEVESGSGTLTLVRPSTDQKAAIALDLGERTFKRFGKDGEVAGSGASDQLNAGVVKEWFASVGLSEGAEETKADALTLLQTCLENPAKLDETGFAGSEDYGHLRSSGGSWTAKEVDDPASAPPLPLPPPAPQMPTAPDYWNAMSITVMSILGSVYLAGVFGIWLRHRALVR